jgi:hypothetical protein
LREIASEREVRINRSVRKANEVLRAIGIEDAVDDSANNEGYSFMYDPTPKN